MLTFLKFLLLGPFLLLASIPVDCFVYYYNLYTVPESPPESTSTTLNIESLASFITCLGATLQEKRAREVELHQPPSGTLVSFVEVNKVLRQKLNICQHVYDILFEVNHEDDWVRDEQGTLKMQNQGMLAVKIFNELKALVKRCANKEGDIDTKMIEALIHQVTMRIRMLMIAEKYAEEKNGLDNVRVTDDSLFELSIVDPNAVSSALAEEGNELQNLYEALINF